MNRTVRRQNIANLPADQETVSLFEEIFRRTGYVIDVIVAIHDDHRIRQGADNIL